MSKSGMSKETDFRIGEAESKHILELGSLETANCNVKLGV